MVYVKKLSAAVSALLLLAVGAATPVQAWPYHHHGGVFVDPWPFAPYEREVIVEPAYPRHHLERRIARIDARIERLDVLIAEHPYNRHLLSERAHLLREKERLLDRD